MSIHAIDFGRLYRDHLAAAARNTKQASDWDERAAGMSANALQGAYVDRFVRQLDLTGTSSLLDVGCGPGTIGLAVAERLQRVIGVDYSQQMLAAMRTNAAARGLNNVETLHLAWEDDWREVPRCDIVVASRSTMVDDMAAALAKLNAKAHQRVYLTNLVGGRFVDATVIEVLERKTLPLPDYIYIINILYGWPEQPQRGVAFARALLSDTACAQHARPEMEALSVR